jgi:hypothetical protein
VSYGIKRERRDFALISYVPATGYSYFGIIGMGNLWKKTQTPRTNGDLELNLEPVELIKLFDISEKYEL